MTLYRTSLPVHVVPFRETPLKLRVALESTCYCVTNPVNRHCFHRLLSYVVDMNEVATLHSKAERVRQIAWQLTDQLTVSRLLAYADELEAKEIQEADPERVPA